MLSGSTVPQDHSPHSSIGPRTILRGCFTSSQYCAGGFRYSNLAELPCACLEDGGKVERKSVKVHLLKEHGHAYTETDLEGLTFWF